MMNFISFSIVNETVMLGKKTILHEFDFEKEVAQLSEIEEIKLILSPTDFGQVQSLGSYLRCSMELSTANSYTNKLLKSVVFLYMFIVCFVTSCLICCYDNKIY
jgi:hypothetical protein